MIAIPDMSKPKNCAECFYGLRCKAVPRWVTTDESIPKGCPLIDIVTCGECICYRGDHNYCANDYFAIENGFCSYGERISDDNTD